MDLQARVGDRIKTLRKSRGWTQEQLAEASTLHYSYIGGVERGDRNISLETLEKVITALGVPAIELFQFVDKQDSEKLARRAAIDDHMTMIHTRTTEEIHKITKINKEILSAIDTKR